ASAARAPTEAVKLARTVKARYPQLVPDAHPSIAAFGGMFLLMIFLRFVFEEREITWLGPLERLLARFGRVDMLSVCVALCVLLVASVTFAPHPHQPRGTHAAHAPTAPASRTA